ncbi:MAG: hypothetical protein JNM56_30730 [Planctomycetia bacterium]|nr:hypothetical protein [Planctomycetia bacterium]
MDVATPAQALWNQRQVLSANAPRLRSLIDAVGRPGDFSPPQWAQVSAFTLEFAPDLIIELGRGFGNSTCCFLETARLMQRQPPCQLLSLCLTNHWHAVTLPKLQALCAPEWFAPGRLIQGDILDYSFAPLLESAERVLVLWDAHGFEIAECVLGNLLPLLAGRPHAVIMHDMSDLRFCSPPRDYGDSGLWKGGHGVYEKFWIGHICSSVGQAISIIDFATRNSLPLHSADESLFAEFANDAGRREELQRLLGDDLFSLQGHWFWFTLNEAPEPYVFPRFQSDKGKLPQGERRGLFTGNNPLSRLLHAIMPKSL